MLPSDWWRCGGKGWCRQDGATRLLYTFQMWSHNSDSCPVPCNCHIYAHSTPSSASIFHSFHPVGWVLGYCLIHQTSVICFPSFGNSPNFCCTERASLVAQSVKNQPAMQETLIRFLGEEDPLEKGKATHSSILAWRIPWAVWSMGWQRVKHDWATFTHFTGVLTDLFFSSGACVLSQFSRVWLFSTLWMYPSRLLCPWDFLSKNTRVGCHASPGDLPGPGIEPKAPAFQADSLPLSQQGSSFLVEVSSSSLVHTPTCPQFPIFLGIWDLRGSSLCPRSSSWSNLIPCSACDWGCCLLWFCNASNPTFSQAHSHQMKYSQFCG